MEHVTVKRRIFPANQSLDWYSTPSLFNQSLDWYWQN